MWADSADSRHDSRREARHLERINASPKLQRAAHAFLLRLVAENGMDEAARVMRELEGLPALHAEASDPPDQEAHSDAPGAAGDALRASAAFT